MLNIPLTNIFLRRGIQLREINLKNIPLKNATRNIKKIFKGIQLR